MWSWVSNNNCTNTTWTSRTGGLPQWHRPWRWWRERLWQSAPQGHATGWWRRPPTPGYTCPKPWWCRPSLSSADLQLFTCVYCIPVYRAIFLHILQILAMKLNITDINRNQTKIVLKCKLTEIKRSNWLHLYIIQRSIDFCYSTHNVTTIKFALVTTLTYKSSLL